MNRIWHCADWPVETTDLGGFINRQGDEMYRAARTVLETKTGETRPGAGRELDGHHLPRGLKSSSRDRGG